MKHGSHKMPVKPPKKMPHGPKGGGKKGGGKRHGGQGKG